MKLGLYALAVAAAIGGTIGVASAADLGGNCCADLEERIAELESTTVRKGNKKVSLTIYGQVNQGVLYWDDGTESNTYVVNNKTSTTVVGLEGSAAITARLSAGYRVEFELADSNSDWVDQGADLPGVGGEVGQSGRSGVFARHSQWFIQDKQLGRVSVGLQSNATDNIAEMDLSKTSSVSLSSVETWNEGFFLRDKAGNTFAYSGLLGLAGTSGILVGDLFRGNFDGGRGNLVRYDSPLLHGFIASASWGDDNDWAVALRYAGEFSGTKIRAGLGYHSGKILDTDNIALQLNANGGAVPNHQEIVGSVSALHQPTGLFVTLAGGSRDWIETPNPSFQIRDDKYFYVKSGILKHWLPIGDTSIYGEYYRIWDLGLEFVGVNSDQFDEAATSYGLGIVQQIDAADMDVYLAYRHFTADNLTDLGGGEHDFRMDMVLGGARIKF
ncbi:MAG: porin [Hyphomicrobium sp.]